MILVETLSLHIRGVRNHLYEKIEMTLDNLVYIESIDSSCYIFSYSTIGDYAVWNFILSENTIDLDTKIQIK